MGVLDRLFFWRKRPESDATAFDIDIDSCFTLPGAEIGRQVGRFDTTVEHLPDDQPLEEIDAGLNEHLPDDQPLEEIDAGLNEHHRDDQPLEEIDAGLK